METISFKYTKLPLNGYRFIMTLNYNLCAAMFMCSTNEISFRMPCSHCFLESRYLNFSLARFIIVKILQAKAMPSDSGYCNRNQQKNSHRFYVDLFCPSLVFRGGLLLESLRSLTHNERTFVFSLCLTHDRGAWFVFPDPLQFWFYKHFEVLHHFPQFFCSFSWPKSA